MGALFTPGPTVQDTEACGLFSWPNWAHLWSRSDLASLPSLLHAAGSVAPQLSLEQQTWVSASISWRGQCSSQSQL